MHSKLLLAELRRQRDRRRNGLPLEHGAPGLARAPSARQAQRRSVVVVDLELVRRSPTRRTRSRSSRGPARAALRRRAHGAVQYPASAVRLAMSIPWTPTAPRTAPVAASATQQCIASPSRASRGASATQPSASARVYGLGTRASSAGSPARCMPRPARRRRSGAIRAARSGRRAVAAARRRRAAARRRRRAAPAATGGPRRPRRRRSRVRGRAAPARRSPTAGSARRRAARAAAPTVTGVSIADSGIGRMPRQRVVGQPHVALRAARRGEVRLEPVRAVAGVGREAVDHDQRAEARRGDVRRQGPVGVPDDDVAVAELRGVIRRRRRPAVKSRSGAAASRSSAATPSQHHAPPQDMCASANLTSVRRWRSITPAPDDELDAAGQRARTPCRTAGGSRTRTAARLSSRARSARAAKRSAPPSAKRTSSRSSANVTGPTSRGRAVDPHAPLGAGRARRGCRSTRFQRTSRAVRGRARRPPPTPSRSRARGSRRSRRSAPRRSTAPRRRACPRTRAGVLRVQMSCAPWRFVTSIGAPSGRTRRSTRRRARARAPSRSVDRAAARSACARADAARAVPATAQNDCGSTPIRTDAEARHELLAEDADVAPALERARRRFERARERHAARSHAWVCCQDTIDSSVNARRRHPAQLDRRRRTQPARLPTVTSRAAAADGAQLIVLPGEVVGARHRRRPARRRRAARRPARSRGRARPRASSASTSSPARSPSASTGEDEARQHLRARRPRRRDPRGLPQAAHVRRRGRRHALPRVRAEEPGDEVVAHDAPPTASSWG